MRLYILRHGIAVDWSDPDCPPDAQRPLTPDGVEQTRQVAQGLLALGVAPETVVTSPFVRADETGRLAANVLDVPEHRVVQSDHLFPASDPAVFLDTLPRYGEGDILCVGHAPNLDLLLAAAVGGEDSGFTHLRKAGAACIEMRDVRTLPGYLIWLFEPNTLRRLGGH